MRKSLFFTSALLFVSFLSLQTASAQLPVKIKIPKPSQPKPQPSPTESTQPSPTSEAQPAKPAQPENSVTPPTISRSDGQPTIAKDSIEVTAYKVPVYKGNFDVW